MIRAAVLRGPGQVAIEEFPDPQVPRGGMLVRVHAVGICGSDLRSYRFGLRANLPWQTPGHEIAGTVLAVGEGISGWRAGDRIALAADVTCGECIYCRRGFPNLCASHQVLGVHLPGGMTEVMTLTPEIVRHGILNPIPAGVDFDAAALAEPAASVLAAQEDAGVRSGETVVVVGAGPMGTLHAEAAAGKGARVILLARSAVRIRQAGEIVPQARLVDTAAEDPLAVVRAETAGLGAEVVVVAAPTPEAVELGIRAAGKRGRIVLFGGLPKDRSAVPIDINRVHYDEITLMGSFSYRPRHHAQALAAIARGEIRAHKYITHRLPLARVETGLRLLADGMALKVVIQPNPTGP